LKAPVTEAVGLAVVVVMLGVVVVDGVRVEEEAMAGQAAAGITLRTTGEDPAGAEPLNTISTTPLRLTKAAAPLPKAGLVHSRPLPLDEKVVDISPMLVEGEKGWNEVPALVETMRPPLLS